MKAAAPSGRWPGGAGGRRRRWRRASRMFIGGSPMKVATNRLAGRSFSSSGVRELLQHARLHDGDAVGKGDRLGLVVGDEDGRHAALDQIVLDPRAQDGAQLRLELAHRLVEEVEVGAGGPARGRGWRAAAGRPRSWAGSGRGSRRSRAGPRSRRPLRPTSARGAPLAQEREADIVADASAAGRAHSPRTPWRRCGPWAAAGGSRRCAEPDRAVAHLLEARDHAQRRGLAAAGGAEQAHDLAVATVIEVDASTAWTGALPRGPVDLVDAVERRAWP